jgi:hypothetical protein
MTMRCLKSRALRIHDASAVRFAWDHVHATKGLTSDERKEARRRIVERAQKLGLDTEAWDAGNPKLPIVLNAMSLNVATDDEHPNKMPFRGILTRIDEPSDRPPEAAAAVSSRFLLSRRENFAVSARYGCRLQTEFGRGTTRRPRSE